MASQRKQPKKGQRTTPKAIETRERRIQALELKKQGYSFDEIAVKLGYADRSGPFCAVRDLLASWESETVADLRKVENARLDKLIAAHLPGATTEFEPNTSAADVVLKAIRERSRLNGLDAPIKTEISGELKTTTAHDELLDRLTRLAAAAATGEGDSEPEPGRG